MRLALLLLMLPCLLFAQQAAPPLSNVSALNAAAASSLEGYFDSNHSSNGTMLLRFGTYSRNLDAAASVLALALSPEVDGLSCIGMNLSAIFARGTEIGSLVSLPSEGYPDFACDRQWFEESTLEYAWRCDFDNDNCAEYENRTYAEYDMNVTFTFRNLSESVPFDSTLIPLPPNITKAAANASGAENISVSAKGVVRIIKEVNDRTMDFDCHDNFTEIAAEIPISANGSFAVGGSRKLFFLSAPVLREQWYRNNRFDVIVLSQCPLYAASKYLNGNITENLTLRTFNITLGQYNISRLESSSAGAGGWSEGSSEPASPSGLEMDGSSFLFAYEFKSGYSGLGENNLSLMVADSAMETEWFNDTLLSRMLSHSGNVTENGDAAQSGLVRPSILPGRSDLSHLDIGLGLVGVLLIIVFMNFWAPR